MDTATIIVAGVAALALVLVAVLARQLTRQRAAHEREVAALVAASSAETDELRQRLDALIASQEQLRERATSAGLVITDAGTPEVRQVPGSVVVSAAMGEPLVTVAATAHGLRRALSPQSRNRIWFEMRRELRRARKQRKREMRAAWRDLRTGQEPVT